jgi:hypothetical protein
LRLFARAKDHGAIAAPTSDGKGAASEVFGGGGRRCGAGAGVTRLGAAGATAGAAVEPQAPHWPQPLQFGQHHSTLHLRTGTSLQHGYLQSLCTSRTMHLHSPHPFSQHPSPPFWQVLQPPAHAPEPSQQPHFLQHVGQGTQMSLHLQQYLYSVICFISQ